MNKSWPVKKLGEVADFLDNLRKPITASDRIPGPYPYYGANGQQDSVNDYIFDDELILLAEDGGYFGSKTRPVAYRVSGKCWVNNHAHVLKNKNGISDIDYLGYSLMYYDVTPYISGTTRAKLNKSEAMKIPIQIPPLSIQKKIVERLDAIGKAQELCDQQIQKTEELFESILSHEVREIGKEVMLADVSDFQEGPGILAKDFRKTGVPLVRLKGTTRPEVTLEGCNYLDPIMVKQKWSHFILRKGDLLLTTSATLGQVSEVTKLAEGSITYTGIIRFRPSNNVLNKNYLKYFLSSELFKLQAKSAATGGVIKHFGPIHLKKMKIFLPSIEEQQKIVEKLEVVQNYKKLLLKQKSFLKELFDSVLDKSIKGEL